MAYHGERHAVNLVFVFGLVLSEGAVPAHGRQGDTETRSEWGRRSDKSQLDIGLRKNENSVNGTSDVQY